MVCLVKTFYTHRMEAIQLQICKCEWFLCDNINNDNVHNGGGGEKWAYKGSSDERRWKKTSETKVEWYENVRVLKIEELLKYTRWNEI